jgi:hypothetical protein
MELRAGCQPRGTFVAKLHWEVVKILKEYAPMKAILAGAALAAACITPALADYYIVQEPTTKRCTIVEQRPANPGIGIVIGGDKGFGIRAEAESRMKTTEVCRESTTGSGERGGSTVIEERRER